MTATSSDLVPSYLDVTRLAVRSFLARNREPTLTAYTQDLRAFLGWCKVHDREPLWVSRGELEMYVRHLESRGYAAATVARRFGSVATFYKYPVIDGLITASPAAAVTRPRWPRKARSAPCSTSGVRRATRRCRTSGPSDHALACLLGMLGMRVSEARGTDIGDPRYEAGYELLYVLGKGAKLAGYYCPFPSCEPCGKRSTGASPQAVMSHG